MTHDRNKMWRTADGRSIPIQEMKLGHLVNVINWIIDNRESYTKNVLDAMIAEANYRKVFLFAEGRDYPQRVGKRWKIINAETGAGSIEKPPEDYIEAVKDNPAYTRMFKRTQKKRKAEQ